jgi:hypothetical protein
MAFRILPIIEGFGAMWCFGHTRMMSGDSTLRLWHVRPSIGNVLTKPSQSNIMRFATYCHFHSSRGKKQSDSKTLKRPRHRYSACREPSAGSNISIRAPYSKQTLAHQLCRAPADRVNEQAPTVTGVVMSSCAECMLLLAVVRQKRCPRRRTPHCSVCTV